MPRALITGASAGLGEQLARGLAGRGWDLVVTARSAGPLTALADDLGPHVTALSGDVADPGHRRDAAEAVGESLDLLVNNASDLGPSPLPSLAQIPLADVERLYAVNVLAPLALIQATLPALRRGRGIVLNLSSDAA